MSDYQRMPEEEASKEPKTALNESDEEDKEDKEEKKGKVEEEEEEEEKSPEQAPKPAPVIQKKATPTVNLGVSQKVPANPLNEKEKAQQAAFEQFSKQQFPLVRTQMDIEYQSNSSVAYNNSIIYYKDEILYQLSANDDQIENEYDEPEDSKPDAEKLQYYQFYQREVVRFKSILDIIEEAKKHKERESEVQQDKEYSTDIRVVKSFPEIYKVVLGKDIIASMGSMFALSSEGQVCKLNLSKKIDDIQKFEIEKEGVILGFKISPNKRWLALCQELRKLPEKEGENEVITWDLVIQDLEKGQKQVRDDDDYDDEDDNGYDDYNQDAGEDENKISEIRYPIKIYPLDTSQRERKEEFGDNFQAYPTLLQITNLFVFTPDSKNIVARTDLRVVKNFLVDKVETESVVEKMCEDKSRVLKIRVLSDNQTLICMSGGDKDLCEDIKIIDLESTKRQFKLGCSDPLDFCCSSDGKMIFVVDADAKQKKTVIKGFDIKTKTQLINHTNKENVFCSIDISSDSNFLVIDEFKTQERYLNYIKLADYKMSVEEKWIVMDDQCEFLMQYNKKTKQCELWDLKNNQIAALYGKSYPECVCGEYFYCVADLRQDDTQIFRVSSKTNEKEECSEVFYSDINSIQVTKDNKFLFAMDRYYIIQIDIETKQRMCSMWIQSSNFPENYRAYQLSNDEKTLIQQTDTYFYKYNIVNGQIDQDNYKETETNWYLKRFDGLSPDDSYVLARQFYTDRIEKFDLNKLKSTQYIKGHKKDKVLYTCFVENGKNLVTMNAKQLIYWKVKGKEFIKLEQIDQAITPIYGHNNKLTGLRVDGKLQPWSKHLIYELSGNFPQLAKYKEEYEKKTGEEYIKKNGIDTKCEAYLKSLTYIQGPYNKLFPFIFKWFEAYEEDDDVDKIAMIQHMLQNVISPHGFTFLGFLAQTNKQAFIKEALKYQPSYFRDFNGNFPLTLALKKQSVTTVNMLTEFVANDQRLVEQLNHEEVCMLLEFSPSNLPKLINNSISKIRGAAPLGIDKNEDITDFYTTDNIVPDKLHDELCDIEALEEDKKLVVYKNISFKLNLIPGSEESVRFHTCLAACQDPEVFSSDAIKQILDFKWQQLEKKTYFPLFLSAGFLTALLIHVYTQGNPLPLYFLLFFSLGLLGIEIFKFQAGGMKYTSKGNIVLIILLPIYVYQTIYEPRKHTDYILPICNLLSWFQFTTQLKSLTSIRAFMVVLTESILSIKAFLSFFLLMLLTFTTSLLIQNKLDKRWKKFDEEMEKTEKFDLTNTPDLYKRNGLYVYGVQNISQEVWEQFYDTYLKMLGEFGDINDSVFDKIVFMLLTFILCITLLNLVIALMSSAYEEFKEQRISKEQKELNKIILLAEVKLSSQRKKSQYQYLIWMEYQEENTEKKSETTQINEKMDESHASLKRIILDAKNQDDKIEKISSALTLVQKENGLVKKEVTQINSKLDELIKLMKKDQPDQ